MTEPQPSKRKEMTMNLDTTNTIPEGFPDRTLTRPELEAAIGPLKWRIRDILEQYRNHITGADGPYMDEDRAVETLSGLLSSGNDKRTDPTNPSNTSNELNVDTVFEPSSLAALYTESEFDRAGLEHQIGLLLQQARIDELVRLREFAQTHDSMATTTLAWKRLAQLREGVKTDE